MRRSSIAVLVTIVVAASVRGAELRLRLDRRHRERRDPLDAYTATVAPDASSPTWPPRATT